MDENDGTKPFQILSLAGRGYLGLYTADVPAEREEQAGEPLGRRLDLIGGRSVGGLLAIRSKASGGVFDIVGLPRQRRQAHVDVGCLDFVKAAAFVIGPRQAK